MGLMISGASGQLIPIIVNSVNLGSGRITSLDFDQGTDVRRKNYTASFEIQRHAGSGLYSNSGTLNLNSSFFSGSPNVYTFFTTSTGKYIRDFSESFDLVETASGKFDYNKDVSFYVDTGVYSEFGISVAAYASNIINACKSSFGDINVFTAFYPTYYKNQSGITYTNQSFDSITNQVKYTESFKFQSGLNYTWDYNHSIDYSNGLFSISENGSIESNQLLSSKIEAAQTGWATIETGIFGRVSGIYSSYTGIFTYTGGCSLKNLPENSTLSKNACQGRIEYSKTYSNSPFNNSGYVYSYEDSIELDGEGFVVVSENGSIQAIPNIQPSGFTLAYTTYLSKTGEIATRINSLYTSYTGTFYPCYFNTGIGLSSESLTLQEHDGIVSYSKEYTDNYRNAGEGLYSNISHTVAIDEPVHIVNYFPISYSHILAQRAQQSTRGTFVNNIALTSKNNIALSQFINTATGMIRFPDGDDIIVKEYSYQFSPLERNFSMRLGYSYGDYKTSADILV